MARYDVPTIKMEWTTDVENVMYALDIALEELAAIAVEHGLSGSDWSDRCGDAWDKATE